MSNEDDEAADDEDADETRPDCQCLGGDRRQAERARGDCNDPCRHDEANEAAPEKLDEHAVYGLRGGGIENKRRERKKCKMMPVL